MSLVLFLFLFHSHMIDSTVPWNLLYFCLQIGGDRVLVSQEEIENVILLCFSFGNARFFDVAKRSFQ